MLTIRGPSCKINLCPELEVKLLARKKPGPHPEKPLDTQIKTRADKDTMEKIEYCMAKLKITRSEVLRRGVHSLYESLQEK